MPGPWPWRDARGHDGLSARPNVTNERGEGHKGLSDVGYGGDLPSLFPGHQSLWLLKGFLRAHPWLQEKQENMGLDIEANTLEGFCSLSISVAPDAPKTPGAGCSGKPVMTINNLWVKLEPIMEPAQPQSLPCPPTASTSEGETR